AEEALLERDLARAPARAAGDGAGARRAPAAVTGRAGLGARDLDVGLRAEGRLLEGQLEVVAEVGAAAGPAPAAPEEVAEAKEVAEDVAEVREDRGVEAAAPEPGVPEAVVALALLGVAEDAVGLGRLLEALLRLLVARVAVRVVLEGQLPVGGLDLLLAGSPGHPDDLLVVD